MNRVSEYENVFWVLENYKHDPDAVRCDGRRPTDLPEGQVSTESQDPGESSSSSGQVRENSESGQESSAKSGQESENLDLGCQSFTPESGQGPPESISEQELEEASSNAGQEPEELDPEEQSNKMEQHQEPTESGQELEKLDAGQRSFKEPQQEPKESSLNAGQEQEDLDLDFELREPSLEQDLKVARSNSGQEKREESEEPNESVSEPSPIPESNDSDEILSLCEALEAFRIPPPCSSFHASLGKAHFIAAGGSKRTTGSNNVASTSNQGQVRKGRLPGFVAHHARMGTMQVAVSPVDRGLLLGNSHSPDIFPAQTKKRPGRAKAFEGGTSEEVPHTSRFPVSDIRSTLLFHPKHDQLVLKPPPDRPTSLLAGSKLVAYPKKDK